MASRFCAQCGTPLAAGSRFCPSCGASAEAPREADEYGGERQAAGPYVPEGSIGTYARLEYAGFWIRFLALFIDIVVLSIVTSFIGVLFGQGAGRAGGGAFVINTIIGAAYDVIALSRWGQTVGALAVGIKVADVNGGLLSPGAAFLRWIGSIVSGIILLIGYFMMIWDARKQTLHDKIAGSFVVKVNRDAP